MSMMRPMQTGYMPQGGGDANAGYSSSGPSMRGRYQAQANPQQGQRGMQQGGFGYRTPMAASQRASRMMQQFQNPQPSSPVAGSSVGNFLSRMTGRMEPQQQAQQPEPQPQAIPQVESQGGRFPWQKYFDSEREAPQQPQGPMWASGRTIGDMRASQNEAPGMVIGNPGGFLGSIQRPDLNPVSGGQPQWGKGIMPQAPSPDQRTAMMERMAAQYGPGVAQMFQDMEARQAQQGQFLRQRLEQAAQQRAMQQQQQQAMQQYSPYGGVGSILGMLSGGGGYGQDPYSRFDQGPMYF